MPPVVLIQALKHSSQTLELRFEKPFHYTSGQYLYLHVSQLSLLEWHPFTITSCHQESFLSLHIKCLGDWTKALNQLLSVPFHDPPRFLLYGPFDAPAQKLFQYKIAILISTGIGVTPAASLLKSYWYSSGTCTLEKLYFIWINRRPEDFSWFQSLLARLEEKMPLSRLEIQCFMTGNLDLPSIYNLSLQSQFDPKMDSLTRLKSLTRYGRPRWIPLLQKIKDAHTPVSGTFTLGVFYCGPPALSKVISNASKAIAKADPRVQFKQHDEYFN
jgi:NADPH oxidase